LDLKRGTYSLNMCETRVGPCEQMKRFPRIVVLVVVNGLMLAIGLILVELVLGSWLDSSRLNRLNLLKDCVRRFDISNLYEDANPVIQYSRDKYGLRGTYDHPGCIGLLTVGGSTTDQRCIRDGETWQDVLQGHFERAGIPMVVANAGVDGQSTYGHIKNFEWWFPHIPNLKPDYILFYVGLNDFHKEAGYGYDRLVEEESSRGLKGIIRDNSALWHMGRTLWGAYEARVVKKMGRDSIDFSAAQWTRNQLQNDYDFMDSRLDEYADRLRVLAQKTLEFDATPIFATQPSRQYRITPEGIIGRSTASFYDRHAYNGVDYYHMMVRLNGVTESVAQEKGALFVDLAGCPGWEDSDFYDFVHMTPKGARKVGTWMFESLRDLFTQDE